MSTVTDPTDDDGCPGCGALDDVQPQPAPPTVQAWSCTACGMNWATTVANPALRVALAIIGLLPTPPCSPSCVPRSLNALTKAARDRPL